MKTDRMPLIENLLDYIGEQTVRFHMPGHKGGKVFSEEFLDKLVEMDITEIPGSDNLHHPTGAIAEAQRLAAEAFKADRSYFLVNGSTCGIYAMIMAACPPGSKLLVPRNCHKSVWNALILGDIKPVYLQPGYDHSRQLVTQISLEEVEKALDKHPDAVGLVLVHPNYYGMCSHIEEIARILHSRGKVLLVDEAHGAHFPFHPDLPISAGEAGADLWVQSAHKSLPAFTQSAYLHGREGRVDFSRLEEMLRIVQTTSPSYMLMASLDWARNTMANQGEELISRLIDTIGQAREKLKAIGIPTLDQIFWREVAALDPTRLVLDLSSIGITGYKGEELLRREGIQVEMSDCFRLILICTIADGHREMDKLVEACKKIIEQPPSPQTSTISLSISREIPKQILSPREAFYSIIEKIPLEESPGRICANAIGAYPPGIPRFCPGELIDKAGLEELIYIKENGGSLFGVTEEGMIDVVKC